MFESIRRRLTRAFRPPESTVAETSADDPREWSPDDGAGYIPTEEGGSKRGTRQIHALAKRHLPGDDYTIHRTEFNDGTTCTRARYSEGWSATNYQTYELRKERGELWIEYYEGDVRRDRRIFRFELTDRVI